MQLKEIYLRDCELEQLSLDAFARSTDNLEILDLSGNNLNNLSTAFFTQFPQLR